MPSPQAQRIVDQLEAFSPRETEDSAAALELILEGLPDVIDPEAVLPSIFGVMERNPEADLGSPGPLVHEAEAVEGYATELAASVARQPSLLALWMINRILNVTEDKEKRLPWLAALNAVIESSACSETLRQEAQDFLVRQSGASAA